MNSNWEEERLSSASLVEESTAAPGEHLPALPYILLATL